MDLYYEMFGDLEGENDDSTDILGQWNPVPHRDIGAQTAPTLEDGRCLACTALEIIYAHPSQPDPPRTIRARDAIIRARYAAGVSQAELARQFGISYQRVHQILRGRRQ